MRYIINLVLLAIIGILVYFLAKSIQEPIKFHQEYNKRDDAVITKLKQVRVAQNCYRGITDSFANNYTDLVRVLRNDTFEIKRAFGNPDVENQEVRYETSYVPAADSIKTIGLYDKLDSIAYVPYSDDGAQFKMQSKWISYQSTTVPVVEVSTQIKSYMGPYADLRFRRYDSSYDPTLLRKFGDLGRPTTAGNWEK